MGKRKGQNKKSKAAAAGKTKRAAKSKRVAKSKPAVKSKRVEQAGARHGQKTEIERLDSPGLLQLLIQKAMQDGGKPKRKTERIIGQAAREILIRLGHKRKEAKELTEILMEQLQ